MAGPYLSANGKRLTAVSMTVPWYGAAVCDVALAGADVLVSPVTLAIGNLTRAMAVARDPTDSSGATLLQRTLAGVTTARLVAGFGTWPTPVKLNPCRAPAGGQVRLSTVLRDLAQATGAGPATREQVTLAAGLDRDLGPLYCPETGAPAGRILAALAGALWYIDEQGVTQIATTRPTSAIKTVANMQAIDGGKGWLQVATEDVASWATPGNTYTSPTVQPLTIRASRVTSSNDGILRIEVLT